MAVLIILFGSPSGLLLFEYGIYLQKYIGEYVFVAFLTPQKNYSQNVINSANNNNFQGQIMIPVEDNPPMKKIRQTNNNNNNQQQSLLATGPDGPQQIVCTTDESGRQSFHVQEVIVNSQGQEEIHLREVQLSNNPQNPSPQRQQQQQQQQQQISISHPQVGQQVIQTAIQVQTDDQGNQTMIPVQLVGTLNEMGEFIQQGILANDSTGQQQFVQQIQQSRGPEPAYFPPPNKGNNNNINDKSQKIIKTETNKKSVKLSKNKKMTLKANNNNQQAAVKQEAITPKFSATPGSMPGTPNSQQLQKV